MRVLFLGTPDFAVPSLEKLCQEGFDIVGVITQPDRPRGRGHKMMPCETKACAESRQLKVFCFDRIRDAGPVELLRSLKPDVMVTAAYGQILSQKILDIPPMGCVNVHGSLLPKYRGAAPIQWSIINGEKETGITTMFTERGVDTGDILLQRKVTIGEDETAGELFDRLAELGAEVLVDTLKAMEAGTIQRTPQDHDAMSHFPMLQKSDGEIDFGKTAQQVHDLVRGVTPWPGATMMLGDKKIKVHKTKVLGKPCAKPNGTVIGSDDKGLLVAAGGTVLRIEEMQLPGKKRMNVPDLLRGFPIENGTVLS